MTQSEMAANDVSDLGNKTVQHGMQWFHLPIGDDQAPSEEFNQHWQECRHQINTILDQGKHIAIHCKGGQGRTGLIAIQVLLEHGASLNEASDMVRSLRPKALTPTIHQQYIQRVAESLK